MAIKNRYRVSMSIALGTKEKLDKLQEKIEKDTGVKFSQGQAIDYLFNKFDEEIFKD